MARQQRLILPGLPLHIVQRGVDRMSCFRSDTDFIVYLSLLAQLSRPALWRIHAYCLMSNHVHLLATPPPLRLVLA